MSGKLDYFMAGVGAADIIKNASTGDYVGGGLGAIGDAAEITKLYLEKKGSEKVKKALEEGAAPIIEWTIFIITLLEQTAGWENPDEGQAFHTGSTAFGSIKNALDAALPDAEKWTGTGSETYAKRIAELMSYAEKMEDTDEAIKGILEKEAKQVMHTRQWLAGTKDSLALLIFVAVAIRLSDWLVGPGWARIFEIAVSTVGLSLALSMLSWMAAVSADNGHEVAEQVKNYSDVLGAAKPTGTTVTTTTHAAVTESTVSSFSSGLSGGTAVAGSADGSGDEPARQGAGIARAGDTGEGQPQSPGQGVPAVASGPGTTPTAVSAMPSLSQLKQTPAQSSPQSGRRVATQDQGGNVPAVEEAETGAAAGAGDAERAPVDVAAVGAEKESGPSPVGRTL